MCACLCVRVCSQLQHRRERATRDNDKLRDDAETLETEVAELTKERDGLAAQLVEAAAQQSSQVCECVCV